MKRQYLEPTLDIFKLIATDIITSSNGEHGFRDANDVFENDPGFWEGGM